MPNAPSAKILLAAISSAPLADRRGEHRWRLRFATGGETPRGADIVEIHDLSERGLRLETMLEVSPGETVAIDLPGTGRVEARVVWRHGTSCGCEFLVPLESVAVKRIILSTPSAATVAQMPGCLEIAIGIQPSVEHLASWKAEFERTQGRDGYRLAGFRQRADGLTLAIVEPV